MRKWIVQAALAFAVAGGLVGCTQQPEQTYSSSAGSLAISRDDSLLFAVDQDNEVVSIVDAKTQKKLTDVKVGKAPERVVASPDNVLYISNRGSRSVSVVKQVNGAWQETAKIDVNVEPVGLALSPGSDTLYVVNSTALDTTDYGTLTAIDTKSNQVKWDLPVGEEPRGVALIEGGKKALVTLYKKGDVVTVDLTKPEVVKQTVGVEKSAIYEAANKSRNHPSNVPAGYTPTAGSISTFQPRAAADVVTTPDGTRAFVPVVWSREDAITAKPSVFGGYYGSGGPCNLGAIATPGLVTIDATNSEPLVDDLTACSYQTNTDEADYPPSTIGTPAVGAAATPIQGPVTGVVDPTGEWLYVVNRETNNVAIMPTGRRTGDGINFAKTGSSVWKLVDVGAGPNGIALSHDGRHAFVYNQLDHSLSVLEGKGEGAAATVQRLDSDATTPRADDFKINDDILPEQVVTGRKLFFAGADSRMTSLQTGVACNTCHVEGREDGHVWVFPDGPRQTPALAGRMLAKTAPYHWSGEFATMRDFLDHTVRLRMGGSEMTGPTETALTAYLAWQPPADNPFKTAQLSAKQLHGAQLFQQAQCNSCHSGEALTNNTDADVGTLVTNGTHNDNVTLVKAFNVPSLLGLARTAPYLHDGSAGTLQQRLRKNVGDKHGVTSNLSDADMDDLVAYLKTL
ncbi:MAG: c-type cytochrome [Myxococcaceae bacterium]